MPKHTVKIKSSRKKLNNYDGMSATKSTLHARGEVLDKIIDHDCPDCVKYGFYISPYWESPVPDYTGDGVQNEITLKNVI